MKSYRTSSLNSERQGPSVRQYGYDNSRFEWYKKRTKIPKMPQRTYSLEGKRSSCSSRKSTTRSKASITSMIPRLEWRKLPEKQKALLLAADPKKKKELDEPHLSTETVNRICLETKSSTPITTENPVSVEGEINKDLIAFKNNVLRIPEYWTDAGQTVTKILKNAVSIITKQYPSADVEAFEQDIQTILKATEAVKQQILMKTENIINKANQMYFDKIRKDSMSSEEDIKMITKKMVNLKNEVNFRKNVFGDLLKCGSEMKELLELEKTLKLKSIKSPKKGNIPEKESEVLRLSRHFDGKKPQSGRESFPEKHRKKKRHILMSCGDVKSPTARTNSLDDQLELKSSEEKAIQTEHSWTKELRVRDEYLKDLNQQVLELEKLCREHISRFKNFNIQIKMKGICNKSTHSKEFFYDEKHELVHKNSKLAYYNKDLESVIKQKDQDLHQKEKLINQQRKLLSVRDELIVMLKNRCNAGEPEK